MADLKDTTVRGDLEVTGKISGGMYDVGDTITLEYMGGGYVTSSGTGFRFSIPIPPVTHNVNSFTASSIIVTARQGGNYVLGSSTAGLNLLSQGTVTFTLHPGSMVVKYAHTSTPTNIKNNDSVGYQVNISGTFK